MKKYSILITMLFSSFGFSQETTIANQQSIFSRKHELKFGAIKLISGGIFEVTYEHIQNKNFTYGSSVLLNFDKGNSYPENFSITPFARMYFQESKEYGAKGFFVEVFIKYISGNTNYYFENQPKTTFNTGSYGLSLGKKWINSSGFVFEALVGFGRNTSKVNTIADVSFRGDLFVGYRF